MRSGLAPARAQPHVPHGPSGNREHAAEDAATVLSVLCCFLFCFVFNFFCHFSKKKKNPAVALPSRMWCIGGRLGPSSRPALGHKTKMAPSPGLAEGPWPCPAPIGLESLLHDNGTEPGTERTVPFSKCIYMHVYSQNRTQSLALPRGPPRQHPSPKTTKKKSL